MLCNNVKDIVLFYHVFNSKNNFIFPVTLIRILYIETIIEKKSICKAKNMDLSFFLNRANLLRVPCIKRTHYSNNCGSLLKLRLQSL